MSLTTTQRFAIRELARRVNSTRLVSARLMLSKAYQDLANKLVDPMLDNEEEVTQLVRDVKQEIYAAGGPL